jgi:hypothetical protein
MWEKYFRISNYIIWRKLNPDSNFYYYNATFDGNPPCLDSEGYVMLSQLLLKKNL